MILQKRNRDLSVEFALRWTATCRRNRELLVHPLVQATTGADPDASVLRRKNSPDRVAQQILIRRKAGDGKFAKAIETAAGGNPDIAFKIFEKGGYAGTGKPIRLRKVVRSSAMK